MMPEHGCLDQVQVGRAKAEVARKEEHWVEAQAKAPAVLAGQ